MLLGICVLELRERGVLRNRGNAVLNNIDRCPWPVTIPPAVHALLSLGALRPHTHVERALATCSSSSSGSSSSMDTEARFTSQIGGGEDRSKLLEQEVESLVWLTKRKEKEGHLFEPTSPPGVTGTAPQLTLLFCLPRLQLP